MSAKIVIAALILATTCAAARADEVPGFLAGGQKYVTDAKACTADVSEETDILQLNKAGISGYEFGCNFLQFLDVKDDTDGGVYQHLVISVCGDDSGINRGDMITLTPSSDNKVVVTSQNDYVIQLSRSGDEDSGGVWLVDKEFVQCPN